MVHVDMFNSMKAMKTMTTTTTTHHILAMADEGDRGEDPSLEIDIRPSPLNKARN